MTEKWDKIICKYDKNMISAMVFFYVFQYITDLFSAWRHFMIVGWGKQKLLIQKEINLNLLELSCKKICHFERKQTETKFIKQKARYSKTQKTCLSLNNNQILLFVFLTSLDDPNLQNNNKNDITKPQNWEKFFSDHRLFSKVIVWFILSHTLLATSKAS